MHAALSDEVDVSHTTPITSPTLKLEAAIGGNLVTDVLRKKGSALTVNDLLNLRSGATDFLGKTVQLRSLDAEALSVELARYMMDCGSRSLEGQSWPLVHSVCVRHNWALLSSGVVLVDLPDIQDANSVRGAAMLKYRNQCQAIWIVTDVAQAVDDVDAHTLALEQMQKFLTVESDAFGEVGFVCTKTDNLDVQEILGDFKENMAEACTAAALSEAQFAEVASKLKELDTQLGEITSCDSINTGAAELNRSKGQLRASLGPPIAVLKKTSGRQGHLFSVFTVSSQEMQNLEGRRVSEGQSEVFCNERETGIPGIRAHISRMPDRHFRHRARPLLSHLQLILLDVVNVLQLGNADALRISRGADHMLNRVLTEMFLLVADVPAACVRQLKEDRSSTSKGGDLDSSIGALELQAVLRRSLSCPTTGRGSWEHILRQELLSNQAMCYEEAIQNTLRNAVAEGIAGIVFTPAEGDAPASQKPTSPEMKNMHATYEYMRCTHIRRALTLVPLMHLESALNVRYVELCSTLGVSINAPVIPTNEYEALVGPHHSLTCTQKAEGTELGADWLASPTWTPDAAIVASSAFIAKAAACIKDWREPGAQSLKANVVAALNLIASQKACSAQGMLIRAEISDCGGDTFVSGNAQDGARRALVAVADALACYPGLLQSFSQAYFPAVDEDMSEEWTVGRQRLTRMWKDVLQARGGCGRLTPQKRSIDQFIDGVTLWVHTSGIPGVAFCEPPGATQFTCDCSAAIHVLRRFYAWPLMQHLSSTPRCILELNPLDCAFLAGRAADSAAQIALGLAQRQMNGHDGERTSSSSVATGTSTSDMLKSLILSLSPTQENSSRRFSMFQYSIDGGVLQGDFRGANVRLAIGNHIARCSIDGAEAHFFDRRVLEMLMDCTTRPQLVMDSDHIGARVALMTPSQAAQLVLHLCIALDQWEFFRPLLQDATNLINRRSSCASQAADMAPRIITGDWHLDLMGTPCAAFPPRLSPQDIDTLAALFGPCDSELPGRPAIKPVRWTESKYQVAVPLVHMQGCIVARVRDSTPSSPSTNIVTIDTRDDGFKMACSLLSGEGSTCCTEQLCPHVRVVLEVCGTSGSRHHACALSGDQLLWALAELPRDTVRLALVSAAVLHDLAQPIESLLDSRIYPPGDGANSRLPTFSPWVNITEFTADVHTHGPLKVAGALFTRAKAAWDLSAWDLKSAAHQCEHQWWCSRSQPGYESPLGATARRLGANVTAELLHCVLQPPADFMSLLSEHGAVDGLLHATLHCVRRGAVPPMEGTLPLIEFCNRLAHACPSDPADCTPTPLAVINEVSRVLQECIDAFEDSGQWDAACKVRMRIIGLHAYSSTIPDGLFTGFLRTACRSSHAARHICELSDMLMLPTPSPPNSSISILSPLQRALAPVAEGHMLHAQVYLSTLITALGVDADSLVVHHSGRSGRAAAEAVAALDRLSLAAYDAAMQLLRASAQTCIRSANSPQCHFSRTLVDAAMDRCSTIASSELRPTLLQQLNDMMDLVVELAAMITVSETKSELAQQQIGCAAMQGDVHKVLRRRLQTELDLMLESGDRPDHAIQLLMSHPGVSKLPVACINTTAADLRAAGLHAEADQLLSTAIRTWVPMFSEMDSMAELGAAVGALMGSAAAALPQPSQFGEVVECISAVMTKLAKTMGSRVTQESLHLPKGRAVHELLGLAKHVLDFLPKCRGDAWLTLQIQVFADSVCAALQAIVQHAKQHGDTGEDESIPAAVMASQVEPLVETWGLHTLHVTVCVARLKLALALPTSFTPFHTLDAWKAGFTLAFQAALALPDVKERVVAINEVMACLRVCLQAIGKQGQLDQDALSVFLPALAATAVAALDGKVAACNREQESLTNCERSTCHALIQEMLATLSQWDCRIAHHSLDTMMKCTRCRPRLLEVDRALHNLLEVTDAAEMHETLRNASTLLQKAAAHLPLRFHIAAAVGACLDMQELPNSS
eukprot:gene1690-2345_t